MYRAVRGLEDGEDFDLNAAIAARVDARRLAPSSRLYVARKREERDVAALFLVDMSALDRRAVRQRWERPPFDGLRAGAWDGLGASAFDRIGAGGRASNSTRGSGRPRRIIDLTKETLVISGRGAGERSAMPTPSTASPGMGASASRCIA